MNVINSIILVALTIVVFHKAHAQTLGTIVEVGEGVEVERVQIQKSEVSERRCYDYYVDGEHIGSSRRKKRVHFDGIMGGLGVVIKGTANGMAIGASMGCLAGAALGAASSIAGTAGVSFIGATGLGCIFLGGIVAAPAGVLMGTLRLGEAISIERAQNRFNRTLFEEDQRLALSNDILERYINRLNRRLDQRFCEQR